VLVLVLVMMLMLVLVLPPEFKGDPLRALGIAGVAPEDFRASEAASASSTAVAIPPYLGAGLGQRVLSAHSVGKGAVRCRRHACLLRQRSNTSALLRGKMGVLVRVHG